MRVRAMSGMSSISVTSHGHVEQTLIARALNTDLSEEVHQILDEAGEFLVLDNSVAVLGASTRRVEGGR